MLLLLTTVWLADDMVTGPPAGVLPTHKHHSRASSKVCSQRPISQGGNPDNCVQALMEYFDARIRDTRKVRRGQRSGEGSGTRGGAGGRSDDRGSALLLSHTLKGTN